MGKSFVIILISTSFIQFTIAQVGRVGINTIDPLAMLHVKDSSVLFTGLVGLPGIPGPPPVSGAGTRMMWYPDKAAFRAGNVGSSQWDKDSIGTYSIALGLNTKAKGAFSTALGPGAVATGNGSAAMGNGANASGNNAIALGSVTKARGLNSISMGYFTKASGTASTSMGNGTIASGYGSTSIGFQTISNSYVSLAVGRYNDTTSTSSTAWVATDPLFIIGNGANNNTRSNALTVLKNAKTGINTASPLAMLHVKDSSVLFTGLVGLPGTPGPTPVSGAGTRMMWYPDKAAFRAGNVNSTQWNKDSIGNYSMAMGLNAKAKGSFSISLGAGTIAKGSGSVALGNGSDANGANSTAMGSSTTADASASTAMGSFTNAKGIASTAMGSGTIASGTSSTSMGFQTIAKSYASLAMGRYNDTTSSSSISWILTDPLFIVGNGTANSTRSNAVTVLKNGNVGIGPVITPVHRLHVVNNQSNDGGWEDGIMVENTHAATGEAAISFRNVSMPSSKQWTAGLNQSPTLSFSYGSSFNGAYTKMVMDTLGNIGIGTLSPAYKLHLSTNSAGKPTSNTWTIASDARLKKDVHKYEDGLEELLNINPVWFTYTGEADMPQETGVGVLAQELRQVAPYMVGTWNYKDENGDTTPYLSVDNGAMTYMLVNAVKEQQEMINDQQQQIELLIKELAEIKQKLEP